MILFLVLCASIPTLRGKPLPPSLALSSEITTNVTSGMACGGPAVSDNGSQQLRTVYDIVKTCLFTIFACVWTSIHPNINGPRDSWWTCVKRRVVTMLYAVIAPDMILLWALLQRRGAQEIADQYNEKFADPDKIRMSILGRIRYLFQPLPEETTWRGNGQLWTVTHGFFVQMGGFILYENGYPKQVLEHAHLEQLLQENAIEAPTVTERDLQDRSKGDTISKAIVMLQTTWFMTQCIARVIQHLPLSEMEVLTLAFAVMNMFIYAAWWNKPQRVGMAICVSLKEVQRGDEDSATSSTCAEPYGLQNLPYLAPACLPQANYQQSYNNSPLRPPPAQQPSTNPNEKDGWLQHMTQKYCHSYGFPFFLLIWLPLLLFTWMLRPFGKMSASTQISRAGQLRVPIFHSAKAGDIPHMLAFCVIGTIFGAIHFFGWSCEFSSSIELTLWRGSAIMLTVLPFMMILVWGLSLCDLDSESDQNQYPGVVHEFTGTCLSPIYIGARLVVVVLAFKAIQHPPHNILLDVSWTKYIPHL